MADGDGDQRDRISLLEGLLAGSNAAQHRPTAPNFPTWASCVCFSCGNDWPCWTARVRDALAQTEGG